MVFNAVENFRALATVYNVNCVRVSNSYIKSAVWYGMVNVDLYSAIIKKVSNALNTLVSGKKPGFQTLSKGLVVLLCAEVVHSTRVLRSSYV